MKKTTSVSSVRRFETPDQVMSKFWSGLDTDFEEFYSSNFGNPSSEIRNKIQPPATEQKPVDKEVIDQLIMAPPPTFPAEDKPVFSTEIWGRSVHVL